METSYREGRDEDGAEVLLMPWFPRHCSRCGVFSRKVELRPTHYITEYVMWKTYRCLDEEACVLRVNRKIDQERLRMSVES